MKKKIDKNVVSYRNDFHFFSVSKNISKKKLISCIMLNSSGNVIFLIPVLFWIIYYKKIMIVKWYQYSSLGIDVFFSQIYYFVIWIIFCSSLDKIMYMKMVTLIYYDQKIKWKEGVLRNKITTRYEIKER